VIQPAELDVDRVRAGFPALTEEVAYFDGPGGSQLPSGVGEAIAGTNCSGIANRGSVTVAERRADTVVVGAREAVADLLGCDPVRPLDDPADVRPGSHAGRAVEPA